MANFNIYNSFTTNNLISTSEQGTNILDEVEVKSKDQEEEIS
jgi:hypothetical protein